ncbi:CaiB/BaiF CoA transferase family protein [Mycolicibacterium monacense]|uniref:CoA transferase n=1 Tax=Mycolicibacterium monacense TaxID=85693 RepID=A0AAD1IRP1_MYCMB|nr:CoA transferase [Mycolicibacterium monacense]MDA4104711.1 carnitine dehydratase [Mycolicibacterium monacense DSM 44395]ORB22741.1 carnitine dehydratase [Mycolicibacterium monacense DSM 44395]QHP87625.1 CoA transferase [Mycolicibacterium monacense DSM 44395]BBZ59219.1 CoA transferase [Mycolicibacterium monacense]
MQKPMTGVRVLEVAQFTFVPSAGAVLADWGADVVKIENPVTGDAQRGLVSVQGRSATAPGVSFAPTIEAPNRGKRSVGLSLALNESRPVFEELVRRSDVFLTNHLPQARAKLRIDLDEIRRINPAIIYVAGSGFGSEGPDSETGAHDVTAFWARAGSAEGVTPVDSEVPTGMPAGGFGDNIGGITIAGAVAAALYGRQTTGQTSVIDVSLLAVGAWANQFSVNLAMLYGCPLPKIDIRTQAPGNPLTGAYRCSDGRYIQLSMLQPTRYWAPLCRLFGLFGAADDERFGSLESLAAHADEAMRLISGAIGTRTFDECKRLLNSFGGQWAPVQDAWEVANDESLIANGRIADVVDVHGIKRKLVANPVKFDEADAQLTRAPMFAEHTDEVLRELGLDDLDLVELKIEGAIT